MTSNDDQWGTELDAAGLGGLVQAVTDPLAHLAEAPIEGDAGSYWPQTPADEDTDAARDAAVARAMKALEGLLAATQDGRLSAQSRLHLLGAVDRALADPKAGYLHRLRVQRSVLLRERIAAGASMATLAVELGVGEPRVRKLVNNNRTYISASRKLALQTLREEGEARRAQVRAERDAAKEQDASDRLAARVAEGRVLAARLSGGETREQLMAEFGYTRNRIVGLLSDAARADDEGQA